MAKRVLNLEVMGPAAAAAPQSNSRAYRRGAVSLSELVVPCLGAAVAKQGFAAADVVLTWPEIVGARLAAVCEPIRLQWPPKVRDRSLAGHQPTATLVVRVEGAFALELQHMAAVVIERINAHLGWRCVGRLALRQAPLLRETTSARRQPRASAAALDRVRDTMRGLEEGPLRDALVRLGAAVLATNEAKA